MEGRRSLKDEQLKAILERVIMLPMRLRHRASARQKYKARVEAIASTRYTLERATQLRLENLRIVFNVALYLLLFDQDLADFTDDLVCAIGDRRRAFLAKHEAVLLYEAVEDLRHLLGRDLRNAVKALGTSDEEIARLNTVSSELTGFWDEQREFLGAIRNALSAHREQDALRYLRALEQLRPLEVMQRAADLSQRIERLVRVLTEVARLTRDPMVILRDMVGGGKTIGAG
jgi:predicted O-linked N-acetylglucosamine transferase (SPINDLY family)